MADSDRYFYFPNKDRSHWQPDSEADLPLTYLAWGRRDFSQEFLPECRHEGWVCTIVEEGNPTMQIRGEAVQLAPRQMIFIGPDCSFGWPTIEGSTCKFVQWMWMGTGSDVFGGLARDAYIVREIPRGKYQPLRENHNQCRREAQMSKLDGLSVDYLDACQQLFEVLVERVLNAEERFDSAEARVELAIEWMRSNLDSKEPIARLCDYLDVSQSTLHRLFKAQTDQSAGEHFHRLRMQEARRLLLEGDGLIKEVALELGYNHINDFSRAYKLYFGCRPSEERS